MTNSLAQMNFEILDSGTQTDGIGIRFRRPKPGPEQEFVQHFLDRLRIDVPQGHNITLFREPKIETGAPDLVVVVWDAETASCWNINRRHLKSVDIRVMHYLTQSECTTQTEIESLFSCRVKNSLDKLEAAEMVYKHGERIYAKPISELYATTHIIAVEAKVAVWRQALDQAFRNLWFASSSYVLLSRVPREDLLRAEANSLGVGVWGKDDICWDINLFPSNPQPTSYASWLFNDWSWRASVNTKTVSAEKDVCNGS